MAKGRSWKGKWVDVEVCCGDLVQSAESGMDAEGYGPLTTIDLDGGWRFNSDMKRPSLCPWCGAPANVAKPDDET